MRAATPSATKSLYGFAEAMREVDAAIRRERRPLPSHDLHTENYRRWAAAVLEAEDKHAVDDSWRCIRLTDAALLFDHYKPRQEALPFFLRHERLAGVALAWSIHLDLHDGSARVSLGRWQRQEWRRWAAERWTIKLKFAAAMKDYRDARAAYEAETAIKVTRRAA